MASAPTRITTTTPIAAITMRRVANGADASWAGCDSRPFWLAVSVEAGRDSGLASAAGSRNCAPGIQSGAPSCQT
jgi:hypothetical protein